MSFSQELSVQDAGWSTVEHTEDAAGGLSSVVSGLLTI